MYIAEAGNIQHLTRATYPLNRQRHLNHRYTGLIGSENITLSKINTLSCVPLSRFWGGQHWEILRLAYGKTVLHLANEMLYMRSLLVRELVSITTVYKTPRDQTMTRVQRVGLQSR